jgi:hypothetical protein
MKDKALALAAITLALWDTVPLLRGSRKSWRSFFNRQSESRHSS